MKNLMKLTLLSFMIFLPKFSCAMHHSLPLDSFVDAYHRHENIKRKRELNELYLNRKELWINIIKEKNPKFLPLMTDNDRRWTATCCNNPETTGAEESDFLGNLTEITVLQISEFIFSPGTLKVRFSIQLNNNVRYDIHYHLDENCKLDSRTCATGFPYEYIHGPRLSAEETKKLKDRIRSIGVILPEDL